MSPKLLFEGFYDANQSELTNYGEYKLFSEEELINPIGFITFIAYDINNLKPELLVQTNIVTVAVEEGTFIVNYVKVNKLPINTLTTYVAGFNDAKQCLYTRVYINENIRKITLSTLE